MISDEDYSELLDMLRRDLQLDVTADVLAGTAGQATINDGLPAATAATTGSATALPALPAGYLIYIDATGTVRKIPFYNN